MPVPDDVLSWSEVAARLAVARTYWLCTTMPSGAPHAAPAQIPAVVLALSAKYTRQDDQQYLPDANPDFDVVYAISPHSAMMWHVADYEASQRRWPS